MKLPLETIKQMYNLPQNASTIDVIKFANDNNIVIDFSNTNNNAQNTTNINNPSGSIYGDNSSQSAVQQQPASKPSAKASSNKTNLNIDFTNPTSSSGSGKTSSPNNNSVFGFGNSNQPEDDYFLGFRRTTTQDVSKNITASGQVKQNEKSEKDSALSKFLDSALAHSDKTRAKFKSRTVDPDKEKIVKIRFTADGKKEKTYEDGSVKIEELSQKELEIRSKFGENRKVSSVEYKDGKTIVTMADGKTMSREARFGEHGFVKDGNSIDEDLISVLGEDKVKSAKEAETQAKTRISEIDAQLAEYSREQLEELKKTDPKRAKEIEKQQKNLRQEKAKIEKKIEKTQKALAKEYIKKVYKECGGDKEKIKAKINSLVKNSDMNSEASKQMVRILGSFHEKYSNLSEDEMADVLANVMDPSTENGADNTVAIAETATHEKGKTGKAMRKAYAEAAKRTGNEKIAAQALAQNIGHAVDPETGEVDVEAAQDIGRIAIDLDGRDGAMAVATQIQQEDSDDLKLAANKPIDEYAAQTGDEEVMQASVDVITSIEDADKQVQANEQAHKTYEEMGASDEIKQKRAEIVGKNLYNFNENARTQIDEYERRNDINNAYSNAAKESKAQYEAEQKAKAAEENTNSNVNSDSKDSNASEHSISSISESARRISGIVNNHALNATQKAKQIRTLNPKEQSAAISQVIKTATLPEIKSLALSGFKTEIINCLLANYSSENQSILETLEQFMNDGEKERYQKVVQQHQSLNLQPKGQAKQNFFTM